MEYPQPRLVPLGLAVALALGATVGSVLGQPAPSIFLGLIAIPVGLYAALATERVLVPVALAAAMVGASVIGFWIYELVVAISKSP